MISITHTLLYAPAVVDFYRQLGFEADPEGIKGMPTAARAYLMPGESCMRLCQSGVSCMVPAGMFWYPKY